MSKDESYIGKTRAIRACIAEHPNAAPEQIVRLLEAGGLQVSPAHVIAVQTVARSERFDKVAVAS